MKNWKELVLASMLLLALTGLASAGETLYNGIVLPDQWPPEKDRLTLEVMEVPYLDAPPEVIPIDVGRQLFVDDFLVEKSNLRRRFHLPTSHPNNPVIGPDREWERYVLPYSGGVWHDPADNLFKMWYCCRAGEIDGRPFRWGPVCLATSTDGVNWDKPDMGDGTNIVLDVTRDSSTVWLDHDAVDANERFKYFATEYFGMRDDEGVWGLAYRSSADGIHWSEPNAKKDIWGDRTTVFYNPFRKVWVLSQRTEGRDDDPDSIGRSRSYLEASSALDLVDKATYNEFEEVEGKSVLWTGADKYDPRHPWIDSNNHAQLYNLDAAPYESLMLGYFTIFQGDPRHKNLVLTGFSRDGFHWWRPDRRPFMYDERGEGWILNRRSGSGEPRVRQVTSNIQSAAGGCVVVGDELYFYAMSSANRGANLYVLRRDGFASMDAGEETETLITRPVTFQGKYLFVNVDCPKGELQAEVLDKDGEVIGPFTIENCEPVSSDKTMVQVNWQQNDLADLAGTPVRFRFHLTNGSLYAFWVSPDKSGASHGYVGAGGPGFTGPTDTVGKGSS